MCLWLEFVKTESTLAHPAKASKLSPAFGYNQAPGGSRTVNTLTRRALALLALGFCLVVSSCADKKPAAVTDSPNPKLATSLIKVGSAEVLAEIATTAVEQERGLMFRSSLPDGTGMLFIFNRDQQLGFWMKNTKLPLSLAYISSSGTIRQIVDLVPHSLASVQSDFSVRYALEVPRGWFERAGVKVGDKIGLGDLPK
jgi:uncharacterized protein